MKRIFALLLAIMMIFSLVACVEEVESDNEGKTNTGDVASKSKNKITFTELVAVDNDECSIKITGIDPDDMWGYSLNVQLENKSADKKYMFSVESAVFAKHAGVTSAPSALWKNSAPRSARQIFLSPSSYTILITILPP